MQFEVQLPPGLPRRLAAVAALVVVGAVLYWWLSSPVPATSVPVATVTAADVPTGGDVVVDVVGDVRRPGVVRLPLGSRVIDAVDTAGGLRPGARAVVNLARVLVDGEQIVVGGGGSAGRASAKAADGRVNINSADASTIEQLPGVGPVLAQRIVDYRDAHGPFRQVRDLLDVPGIGDAKFAQLSDAATT